MILRAIALALIPMLLAAAAQYTPVPALGPHHRATACQVAQPVPEKDQEPHARFPSIVDLGHDRTFGLGGFRK